MESLSESSLVNSGCWWHQAGCSWIGQVWKEWLIALQVKQVQGESITEPFADLRLWKVDFLKVFTQKSCLLNALKSCRVGNGGGM